MRGVSAPAVLDWYRAKTRSVLEKYGPGPRVHFHVGFAEADAAEADDLAVLRERLVAAQEAVLEESGRAFAALCPWPVARLLDVGCGLGGGSLYWAERGARVVALTPVAEHARLVRGFACRQGLADRVTPCVADAHVLPARDAFDAAIAVESSCYLDRPAWFRALRDVLRPGGRVFVIDGFLGDPRVKRAFDAYWRTDLASSAHYLEAAAASGFVLEKQERLNARAAGFWALSQAWTRARLRACPQDQARLLRSLEAHARFQEMYASGAVEYLRLAFRGR